MENLPIEKTPSRSINPLLQRVEAQRAEKIRKTAEAMVKESELGLTPALEQNPVVRDALASLSK